MNWTSRQDVISWNHVFHMNHASDVSWEPDYVREWSEYFHHNSRNPLFPAFLRVTGCDRLVHVTLWEMSRPWSSTIMMNFFLLLSVMNLDLQAWLQYCYPWSRSPHQKQFARMLYGVFLYWNKYQKPDVIVELEDLPSLAYMWLHIILWQTIWCWVLGRSKHMFPSV